MHNVKMELGEIKTTVKNEKDRFRFENQEQEFTLLDFWRWNQSDLIENRTRGILAEFIVKQGLGIKNDSRLEWDSFDLVTEDNIKIEIKSAAYIQAWKQSKLSSISFNIAPTRVLLSDNNYSNDQKRQADVYIFCLLHHKDQPTINPMDLSQWTFFLVTTNDLNNYYPSQKTIGLSSIEIIPHEKCTYIQLRDGLNKLTKHCA